MTQIRQLSRKSIQEHASQVYCPALDRYCREGCACLQLEIAEASKGEIHREVIFYCTNPKISRMEKKLINTMEVKHV